MIHTLSLKGLFCRVNLLALLAFLSIFGSTQAAPLKEIPQELNDDNYKVWFDYIRPKESELKWRKIGWRTKLWPAVLEARELNRPILLWTMNGHPLGCT